MAKIVKNAFQYNAFVAKLLNELDRIKGETRAEIIVTQAFVEFMIDEIFETLVDDDSFRGTSLQLKKKLDYLNKLDWIDAEMKNDINKLAVIRGFMAHRIDIFDQETRELLNEQFEQIGLYIRGLQSGYFKKGKSTQENINEISQMYIRALYEVLKAVQKIKNNYSLKNPQSTKSVKKQ